MNAPLCHSCRYFLRYTKTDGLGEGVIATDHALCVLTQKNEWVIRCNWHQERVSFKRTPLEMIETTI